MQDFIGWMKDEHPEVMESDMGRSLACIMASMLGGVPGALAGGCAGKELAVHALPNKGILKVDGTMKKKQRKQHRKK